MPDIRAPPPDDDGIQWSDELRDIVDTELKPGEVMRLVAVAGAGKSTALRLFVRERPRVQTLFVTFNKAAQEEQAAVFRAAGLAHVQVLTLDGLARQRTCWYHRGEVVDELQLEARHLSEADASDADVEMVRETLEAYMASAGPEIAESHLPASHQRSQVKSQFNLKSSQSHDVMCAMCDGTVECVRVCARPILTLNIAPDE